MQTLADKEILTGKKDTIFSQISEPAGARSAQKSDWAIWRRQGAPGSHALGVGELREHCRWSER